MLAEGERYKLISGDCVEGLRHLPDKSVDHFVFDLPYSEHVDGNSIRGTGHKPGGRKQELGFAPMTPDLMAHIAQQAARLVRRWVLTFSDIESERLRNAQRQESLFRGAPAHQMELIP